MSMNEEDYKKKVSDYFYSSCAAISIALARNTGLLNVFYAANNPLTISEIAERNDFKERYVKELLGALVAAGVVQISEDSTRFHVPEEHKATLKEYAVLCSYPTAFSERFDTLSQCFKKDGPFGITYLKFPAICKVQGEIRRFDGDELINTEILPVVRGLKEKLEAGIDVIEVGCNTGRLLIGLAKLFPKSRFLGGDIFEESLKCGADIAAEMNLHNIRFERLNIMKLPESFTEKYDWGIVHNVIHDLPNPEIALSEIYRCVKPDQMFSIIECAVPGTMADHANNMHACFCYIASAFVCLPASFENADSAAIGAMWGIDDVRKLLYKSGFKIINEKVNQTDTYITHFACQK